MLQELDKNGREVSLKMSFKKTQVMYNRLADRGEDVLLEETPLKKVDSLAALLRSISN